MPPLSTQRQKVSLICGDALETHGLRQAFDPANTGQLAVGSDREGAYGATGFDGEEESSVATGSKVEIGDAGRESKDHGAADRG
jgi:hypothetical protein